MTRTQAKKPLGIFRAKPKAAAAKARPAPDLGPLPEWNLEDLYPSMDSPAFAADLAKAGAECKSFNTAYKGKLETLAKKNSGHGLLQAIERYEMLEELLGRIMSYAGLVYSGDTTDPARMKFYGDTQEKITSATSDLLFFELELNRLDDALAAKLAAGPLKHTGPGSRISARASLISSMTSSSSCSMRNQSRALAPGTGFSMKPSQACASPSTARNSRSSPCSI